MKKHLCKAIAAVMLVAMLPVNKITATVGDIYPQANMGHDTNCQIMLDLKAQNDGQEGNIEQTSTVWRYQYASVGDFSEAAYKDFTYKSASAHLKIDATTYYPTQIQTGNLQPGEKNDVVTTFIAPEDGTVEISNVNKNNVITSGWNGTDAQDGVKIRILKNNTNVWPLDADWAEVKPSLTLGAVYAEVKQGDKIHFRTNCNTNIDNDGVWWNPTVRYVELLYFEQDTYYTYLVSDNESGNYDDLNLFNIQATLVDENAGELSYESSDTGILEPTENAGEFKILNSGTVTVTAVLKKDNVVLQTTAATVNILENNIGGPYIYEWNGAAMQGPVWYYKALVPAGSEPSEINYVDMISISRNETYNFFEIGHTDSYGYIRSDNRIHPGDDGSPTIAFKAPKSGLVKIGALAGVYPQHIATGNNTDGIRYRIMHNDAMVYPDDGSSWKTIEEGNANIEDNYGEIYAKVEEGDFIYFTLDKNGTTANDMSAWSPVVTYVPTTFEPNPLGLSDTVSVAVNMPASDGGVQTTDTLQMAYELGMVDISVEGNNSGSASELADAISYNDIGGEIKFDETGIIDIVFNDKYTGERTVDEMDLVLHSEYGVSSQFAIDFYYTTTEDKETLIELYSSAETRSQSFYRAYPYIRLRDFSGKVKDLYKLHIVINDSMGMKTKIGEIDLNMTSDGDDISAKRAEVNKVIKLPAMFGDNMMLQRDKPIKIWGTGGAETVIAELIDENGLVVRRAEIPVENSEWNGTLEALPGGHEVYTLRIIDASDENNNAEFKNILIGDIWLASGQSNMYFEVKNTVTGTNDIANATYDEIRHFSMGCTMAASTPLTDTYVGSWTEATGENIGNVSAVAYHFARELYLQNDEEIPIGIVVAANPGTKIQSWLSQEVLKSDPDFDAQNDLNSYDPFTNPEDFAAYEKRASASYNAMLHPLLKMNIKGAIWYQGEENGFQPDLYKELLAVLIDDWRKEFNDEELPFYFVQLPPYGQTFWNADWPKMREVQLQTSLTVPNTGMAVITDLGDYEDIHPKNKKPVGQRLAYIAAADTYEKDIEYSGPMYDHITLDGDKVIVHFTHIADGLVAQTRNSAYVEGENDASEEFIPTSDNIVNGFELSNDGVNFTAAQAKIVGDTVEVIGIENPVAVRYGWINYADPELNLFNTANIPASPFRVMCFDTVNQVADIEFSGTTATISGEVVNNDRILLTPSIIIVSYDADGKISDIQIESTKAALGETEVYSFSVSAKAGGKVDVFVWDGIDSMNPITEKASKSN